MKKLLMLISFFITSFAFCYEGLEFPKPFHFEVYKDSIEQEEPLILGMNISEVERILGKPNSIEEIDKFPEGKKDINPVYYNYDGIFFATVKKYKKVTHIEISNSDYSVAGGMFKVGSSLKTFFDVFGDKELRTGETIYNGKEVLSLYYLIDKEDFIKEPSFDISDIYYRFLFDKKTNKCVYIALVENLGL